MALQKNASRRLSAAVGRAAAATVLLMGVAVAIGLSIAVLFPWHINANVSQEHYEAFQTTRPPVGSLDLTYADVASLKKLGDAQPPSAPADAEGVAQDAELPF